MTFAKNTIVAISVSLLLLFGLVGCESKPITMPDLSGMGYTEAKEALADLNLSKINEVKEDGKNPWIIVEENWTVLSQDPEPGAEITRSTQITLVVQNKVEAEAIEKEEQEEQLKSQINSVIGSSYNAAYEKLTELGFIISWIHEVSSQDFTESIRLNLENPDSEFEVPWVVVGSTKLDIEKKTVTLLINTQENMDRAEAEANTEKALSAKLDSADAKIAVSDYGKNVYPYGFKLHYIIGVMAETAEDENTWFLKITCDVTNEYGATMKDLVCEARVTGTSENPQVTYFIVY